MIRLTNVTIASGSFRLSHLNCAIPQGSYTILMGRSGQGKTTILEAICGLRSVRSGKIVLGDTEVQDFAPGDRGVGYVPQDLGLFPTMTVKEHLEFALVLRKWTAADRLARVGELAELLGIAPLLKRRVEFLSGGEAQRVALGRALSFRPQVLLLDEPLSALDEETRQQMQELLKTLKTATGTTTLHVTHSRHEAEQLADQHLLLEAGALRVVDTAGAALERG